MVSRLTARKHHSNDVSSRKKVIDLIQSILLIQVFRFVFIGSSDTDGICTERFHFLCIVSADIAHTHNQHSRTLDGNNTSHRIAFPLPEMLCLISVVLIQTTDQVKCQRKHVLRHSQTIRTCRICQNTVFRKNSRFCILVGTCGIELVPLQIFRTLNKCRRKVANDHVGTVYVFFCHFLARNITEHTGVFTGRSFLFQILFVRLIDRNCNKDFFI